MSKRDNTRPNDPPLAEWQRGAVYDNSLRQRMFARERESPDWFPEAVIIAHILIHEHKDTKWADAPIKYLAQKGHMNFRRMKAAFLRLASAGIIEEHPDNATCRDSRQAMRARILIRVSEKSKAKKTKAQEELRLAMARQVVEAGCLLTFPDGTIMRPSEAKALLGGNPPLVLQGTSTGAPGHTN